MSNAENTMHEGKNRMGNAIKDTTKDPVGLTVKKVAAIQNFDLHDEYMSVIHSLIEHYKQDGKTHDCLAAHVHMKFLEEIYASKGGRQYL